MRQISILLFAILLFSCNGGKEKPNVSGVKVALELQRFEEDLFRTDTTNMTQALPGLQQKYGSFFPIYLQYVLGLDGTTDVPAQLRLFQQQSRFLYDAARETYPRLADIREDMTEAFRYVKHYYPAYPLPSRIVTLIGPVDALAKMGDTYTPDFLGKDFIGISLQFYLGRNFPLYQSDRFVSEVAPRYRSRRFEKAFIVPDAVKLIVDDIYGDSSGGRPLIEQMIEKGKQWYLLDKFLPDAPDSVKTGYTGQQLEWCRSNEGNIWGYINSNTDIYTIDPALIQDYIGEAPFTRGMPEGASPGNIGPWVGWQIIRKFEERKGEMTVQKVLATPARTIFQESKYKPK